MAFMFERNAKNPIDTLIGASTQLQGDLLFSGGLRIDGHVRGNVTGEPGEPTYVVLGEGGRIDGEVRCSSLVVSGEINGPVYVSEMLEIQPKARICGEVYYKVLEMHSGALVQGKLSRHEGADPVLHLAVSEM